jgi:Uma2 family endonuclease
MTIGLVSPTETGAEAGVDTLAMTEAKADRSTLADLVERLGNVPLNRILTRPPLGTATERDVTELEVHSKRLCELVDGVLVEKTVGYLESYLGVIIVGLVWEHVGKHDLGIVLAADGTLRILPDQVRISDCCFISWKRFPEGKLPQVPIPAVAPDLAIEVLSASNTEGEMERKLRDYFAAGVRLVWYIDPRTRTAKSYTSVEACVTVGENESLSGGDVLPGFQLSLGQLFAHINRLPR